MRVAALYDIHGNLPALEAVLHDVRRARVDQIVVGGDVLPGPMPSETLACLRDVDVPLECVSGNGEREVLACRRGAPSATLPDQAREVLQWTATQLTAEDERWIASWPATLRVDFDGPGEILFCHATPRNDTDIFTRFTPEARLVPIFETVGVPLVVCGHTHMQFHRVIGRTRVVNAGSVGMPFSGPGAFWLLLGPGVELRHTSYDLLDAAERIRATAFPQRREFAERNILQPPSEAETLESFSRIELGR
jgi:predicted phosphodiesterase